MVQFVGMWCCRMQHVWVLQHGAACMVHVALLLMGSWLCSSWDHGCAPHGIMAVLLMGLWLYFSWGHGCAPHGIMAVLLMGSWLYSSWDHGCAAHGIMAVLLMGSWLYSSWGHGCTFHGVMAVLLIHSGTGCSGAGSERDSGGGTGKHSTRAEHHAALEHRHAMLMDITWRLAMEHGAWWGQHGTWCHVMGWDQ